MTLLFADAHGSTEMVQHLDPEQVAALFGPLLHALGDIVNRYDGISISRGDGIMALFGAPMLAEGHGLRGCLAALDILEYVSRQEGTLRVRIGLHVGDVLIQVGADGRPRMDELFGSAIHVAARLEQTAEPGTACLSSAAYDLARSGVEALPLPAIKVKGLDEPVGRMLLVGRKQNEARWLTLSGGLTGFVGRERELAVLEAAAAGTERETHIVQVTGEPGIGKSRLLREFVSRQAPITWCCMSLFGDKLRMRVPFHTIGEWTREVLGAPRGQTRPAPMLRAALRQATGLADFRERSLEQALGISRGDNQDIGQLAGSLPLDVAEPISRLVRNVASGRKILVVCEDLESFDTASLRLLPKLLDALAGEAILVVTSSRKRLPLKARTASPTQYLRLGSLREAAARSMLSSLCSPSELDGRGVRNCLQRAGGNPLFLEEIAILAKQESADRPATSLPEFAKPDTVPDRVEPLIIDRLARLPDEPRQVLRIASVIGYEVSADLLERLVGVPRDRLDRILTRLQAEHLLVERSGLPNRRLSFRHALTRDVAYKSLLRRQRQKLHAEVATLLEAEQLADPAHRLEELCYHSARGGLNDKAIQYLQDAAGVAADRGAPGQSTEYLNQALEIAAGLADDDRRHRARIDVLVGLRVTAVLELRYVDALDLLDEAERLATELDDQDLTLTIRARRLRPLNVLGRLSEAIHIGEELRQLSRAAENWRLAIEIAHDLGQAYFERGNFRRAVAVFSEVIDILDHATPTSPVRAGSLPVLICATRAAALAFLGRFAEASADAAAAFERAAVANRSYDVVYARFVQGFVHLFKRELPQAVELFEVALEQAKLQGVRAFIPSLQCGLGHALLLQAASDPAVVQSAIQLLKMARDTATERRREIIRLWATLTLGMASFCAQLDGPARQLTSEAVELGSSLGMLGFLVLAFRFRGLVLAAEPAGRQDALRCLVEGLKLARRLGMRVEAAHTLVAIEMICPARDGARLRLASTILDRVGLAGWREDLIAGPTPPKPRVAF